MLADDFTLTQDEVRVGLFAVRLDPNCHETLKKMRKLFPQQEYNLLRNRLVSRKNRLKARDSTQRLFEQNARLLKKNKQLKKMLAETQA